jgi:hypothetical protein
MKPKSLSPTTVTYTEAFYDSSNNTYPKICVFGMKCKSLQEDMPPCDRVHVENPDKEIAVVKQQILEKNEILEKRNNNSSPIQFSIKNDPFDISAYSTLINSIISSNKGSTTIDLKKGIITIDNYDTPKPPPEMNVSFGGGKNIMSMITTSANIEKELNLSKQYDQDINMDDWEVVTKKINKINSSRSSPTPFKMSNRSSPVPLPKIEKNIVTPVAVAPASPNPPVISVPASAPVLTESAAAPSVTVKRPCKYKAKCGYGECKFEHPEGYIPGSIPNNKCHNGTKCFNQFCKFDHEGYIPKPNVRCLGGDNCHKEAARKGSCTFSHPGDPYYDSIPPNTRK